MDDSTDPELIESMLSTAASMQMLADNLDQISIHSTTGTHTNSRESLHSSSKYDSAFDSHYSEDTMSLNSPILNASYPVETSVLPSILTPPLAYRVTIPSKQKEEEDEEEEVGEHSTDHYRHHKTKRSCKKKKADKVLRDYILTRSSGTSCSPSSPHSAGHIISDSCRSELTNTLSSKLPFNEDVTEIPLLTIHHPEIVYVESASPSPTRPRVVATNAEIFPTKGENTLTIQTTMELGATPSTRNDQTTPPATPHRSPSESSSPEDLISNDSTPTPQRKHTLTPRVTIIYPNDHYSDSDTEYTHNSPARAPRQPHFPKTGTLFYQESLTPLPTAHRHASPSHMLPDRYWDSTHTSHSNRRSPKRKASILRRLKRKRGSFKEEGLVKRRLPVKRSFSERLTYHIRKGWIDYEEDLEFISQPSHPRPVGRMIDKKAGRFHVVQLYKPPGGRYGIYISQNGNRRGVFISRFADSTAEKFYSGLISPGDQIIRVNGKNIGDQSVDYVYDLMTMSDSVIFTVIPISSRSDWW